MCKIKFLDRAKWITSLANAEAGLDSLNFVMPFIVQTSQWAQILSRRESPTISLVRASAKSIKRTLEKLDRDIKELSQEPDKTALTEVHTAFGHLVTKPSTTLDTSAINTPNSGCFA